MRIREPLMDSPVKKRLLKYRLNHLAEGLRVIHGQVGEDFAVQFNRRTVQFAHQFGIGQTLLTGCRIDTGNPKVAEMALLGFAIPVGIDQTFFDGVFGDREDRGTGGEITLG